MMRQVVFWLCLALLALPARAQEAGRDGFSLRSADGAFQLKVRGYVQADARNWYLNRNLRLYFDYERTRFEGGATDGDREDESIFFSRFQISF